MWKFLKNKWITKENSEQEKTNKTANSECQCDGPGYCPVYGILMSQNLHTKCKNSEVWRKNFQNYFSKPRHDTVDKAIEHKEAEYKYVNEYNKQNEPPNLDPLNTSELDTIIQNLEEEGITLDNYKDQQEGLGDVIENTLSKFGITEETIEKWGGIGGCGCQKRKQFLNKIFPFRKKE